MGNMAKRNNQRKVIQRVISKNSIAKQKPSQLTIKIDNKLYEALSLLSNALDVSKNKLIEDILFESGIIQEVDENYIKVK